MLRAAALMTLACLAACAQQNDPLADLAAEPPPAVASAPAAVVTDTREIPPADFSLSITVYSPAARPNTPAYRRPARYIFAPDCVLRVAIGPGCTEQTYPPPIRTLNSSEIRTIWLLTRDAALTSDTSPSRISTGASYTPPDRGTGYLVSTRAGEQSRTFALDPANAPTRRLIEHLAKLSWNAR